MKPIYLQTATAIALTFFVAISSPSLALFTQNTAPPMNVEDQSTPAEVAESTKAASETATMPAFVPEIEYENWLDAPRTSGDWRYLRSESNSTATYASNAGDILFSIQCDFTDRRINLSRASSAGRSIPIRIRTEKNDRTLVAEPAKDDAAIVTVNVSASDEILDAMALTRGRFAIESPGMPALFLPAWGEVTRVIEDCR